MLELGGPLIELPLLLSAGVVLSLVGFVVYANLLMQKLKLVHWFSRDSGYDAEVLRRHAD